MDLLSILIVGGTGAVLARFAGPIARACRDSMPSVLHFLLNLDDRLETKTGIELPAWAHTVYDSAVRQGVAFAEQFVGSPDFWARVLFIVKGRPNLIADRLLALLREWVTKPGALQAEIPPELKEVFNLVKEEAAVKVASAGVASLPASVRPDAASVTETVRAAAPLASRIVAVSPPVNPPKMVSAKDIVTRIEALRKKLHESVNQE